MKIIHVNQPTSNSCVSACIAMISGIDVQVVYDEFHDHYKSCHMNAGEYLLAKGIKTVVGTSESRVQWGSVYLLAVPSLNVEAGMHQIVLDCQSEDLGIEIYDPNEGYENRKYYVPVDKEIKNELEIGLIAYFIDYEIVIEDND